MGASINIIAHDNGVGLSRDTRILAEALTAIGCDVAVTHPDRDAFKRRRSMWVQLSARFNRRFKARPPAKFDLSVMLEHVWPEHLDLGRRNVIVPNPEWYDRHCQRLTGTVDYVWAKTQYTKAIFEALNLRTTLVGFDSEDRFLADVPRERQFFHLAGKSPLKGTDRLVALWQRHPEWPTLTLVQSRRTDAPIPAAPNISVRREYLTDEELRRLQNSSAFHLCPSETEGWGHYIVEGLSVGAVVLTVDAAPMNELVTGDRGVLAPCSATGRKRLAATYQFDEAGTAKAIESMAAMDAARLKALAEAGRDWYRTNKRGFARRLERGVHDALSESVNS